MSSPYYPKSLVINGFLPQSIPAEKILLAFGLGLVGLQLLFSILYARGSHKKGSYGVALWFFTCGIIHSFVEGYFVYYNKSIASKDSFMANVWKEYAKSDSRYMTSDATVVMIEAITAYLWGPLCFYTAYLCYKNNQMRHFLQVLIVFGQLYGDIVYYGSTLLTGSIHCHPDPYYFWFYFVFMNSLWIIFPVLIL
jgi:cholestenol delta-isomerase